MRSARNTPLCPLFNLTKHYFSPTHLKAGLHANTHPSSHFNVDPEKASDLCSWSKWCESATIGLQTLYDHDQSDANLRPLVYRPSTAPFWASIVSVHGLHFLATFEPIKLMTFDPDPASQCNTDSQPCFKAHWARTFKCLWGPGIDSKEWIPPAYVAWRDGTKTLFLLGA